MCRGNLWIATDGLVRRPGSDAIMMDTRLIYAGLIYTGLMYTGPNTRDCDMLRADSGV